MNSPTRAYGTERGSFKKKMLLSEVGKECWEEELQQTRIIIYYPHCVWGGDGREKGVIAMKRLLERHLYYTLLR